MPSEVRCLRDECVQLQKKILAWALQRPPGDCPLEKKILACALQRLPGGFLRLQKKLLAWALQRLPGDCRFEELTEHGGCDNLPQRPSHRSFGMMSEEAHMSPVRRPGSTKSFQDVVLVVMVGLPQIVYAMSAVTGRQRRVMSSTTFDGSRYCSTFFSPP